jgi:hypothetical protein
MNQKTTDMKKLTGFLFVSVSLSSIAQSLTPTVVSSTGDYYVGSAATLSWTLGEVVTDTYNGTSNQLTQGFHQPDLRFSIIEDLATEMTLNLFPNPTNGLVSFEVKNNFDALHIAILDPVWQNHLLPHLILLNQFFKLICPAYANGIYYMQVTTESNQKIKTLKIEKL